MSPVLEEIIEQIHRLPYVERRKLREVLDSEELEIEKERQGDKSEFIRSLRGKYKDSLPNPELRAKWRDEEIELEDKV